MQHFDDGGLSATPDVHSEPDPGMTAGGVDDPASSDLSGWVNGLEGEVGPVLDHGNQLIAGLEHSSDLGQSLDPAQPVSGDAAAALHGFNQASQIEESVAQHDSDEQQMDHDDMAVQEGQAAQDAPDLDSP